MQTHTPLTAVGVSAPIVIAHTQGSTLTELLAQELATAGFRLAIGAEPDIVSEQDVDVVITPRQQTDAGALIDDVRRHCPRTRIVSIVTVGEVIVVHAFASAPPVSQRDRLRDLAASIRRAIRSALDRTGAYRDILSA